MLQLAILGANGRMGRALIEATQESEQSELAATLVRSESSLNGVDAGEMAGIGKIGVVNTPFDVSTPTTADVIIDFTLPDALQQNLNWAVTSGKGIVIGTTGLTDEQLTLIDKAAESIPVVFAANYSVGVNLTCKLLEMASKVMGDYTDIEIVESHHRFKKDAPSGTALALAEVITRTLGRSMTDDIVNDRSQTDEPRDRKSIGISAVRAGDIVGEHTVMFADIGERLEITHKATSRLTFAKGAVRAAQWVKGKRAGLYSMDDVLGL